MSQEIIIGILSSISVGGLFMLFLKKTLADYDKKHESSNEKLDDLSRDVNEIKVNLAKIDGDIKSAIAVKSEFKDMQRDIWRHDSEIKAAFRIIDKKE